MTTLADLERVERQIRDENPVTKSGYVPNELDWADTIAAFIAAQRELDAANGWQPIETAPKDAPFLAILNLAGYLNICTMRWPVAQAKNRMVFGQNYERERVTHWMPLPAPPNPKAEGFKEPTP